MDCYLLPGCGRWPYLVGVNQHGALARSGKVILYISHVLEVVERVCAKVIIIYKGKIMADDSVVNLRGLMSLPTLEDIFSELVQQENMEDVARGIVEVMQGAR